MPHGPRPILSMKTTRIGRADADINTSIAMRINAIYHAFMSTKMRTPKTSADWHPADVVAAVRKAGWTLRRLSIHHGYTPTTLDNALHRPWPKAERLIAEAIGANPEQVWPSRYLKKGMRS